MTDTSPIRALLGPDGPLARTLGAYEHRPEQLRMAEAVAHLLEHEGTLLVEAGTGTGKTLAYLVPAMLSGKKVVISTGTKALQDQIVEKDLPLIEQHLGLTVPVACMKGLGNYVCRRRLRETLEGGGAVADPALVSIARWAAGSDSGDRAELDDVSDDDPVWFDVTSSSETRIGPKCDDYDACFVTRMRRRAEEARIIIVNHHLFFADLATRGPHGRGVIPEYDAVIFDEAQKIEDIATDFFGLRISSRRIESLVNDTRRSLAAERGAARSPMALGDIQPLLDHLSRCAALFFASLPIGAGGQRPGAEHPVGWGAAPSITLPRDLFEGSELTTRFHELDTALEGLCACLRRLAAGSEPIALAARRTSEIRDELAAIVMDRGKSLVRYAQVRGRNVSLAAAPIDLSEIFREKLFFRVPSVVLTSATLSTNGDFAFIRQRLGIDFEARELVVGSPFDYPSQAVLYTPRSLPEPRNPEYLQAAADEIERLIDVTGGGAFVLCTSVRSMRALHQDLRDRLGRPCLLQGERPKASLLQEFRARGDAVLFATSSFWEGIDVPGDALRLVVIDKLPFEVPSDPIVAARIDHLTLHGINAFSAYQVPAAALALKQGFGRLIRSRADRGIVAILDRRIIARGYGKVLLDSLPPCSRTSDFAQVERFWRERLSAATLSS